MTWSLFSVRRCSWLYLNEITSWYCPIPHYCSEQLAISELWFNDICIWTSWPYHQLFFKGWHKAWNFCSCVYCWTFILFMCVIVYLWCVAFWNFCYLLMIYINNLLSYRSTVKYWITRIYEIKCSLFSCHLTAPCMTSFEDWNMQYVRMLPICLHLFA
jgi:hypothetical protein